MVRRNWTRRWWDDHRHEHDLVTSLVFRAELENPECPAVKRRDAMALLDELPAHSRRFASIDT